MGKQVNHRSNAIAIVDESWFLFAKIVNSQHVGLLYLSVFFRVNFHLVIDELGTLNSHPVGTNSRITIKRYFKTSDKVLQSIHHRTLAITHATAQQKAKFGRWFCKELCYL